MGFISGDVTGGFIKNYMKRVARKKNPRMVPMNPKLTKLS